MVSSAQGVIALYGMMRDGEPDMLHIGSTDETPSTEKALRKIMNDPRYWRDSDVRFLSKVRRGFERLYPGNGS